MAGNKNCCLDVVVVIMNWYDEIHFENALGRQFSFDFFKGRFKFS